MSPNFNTLKLYCINPSNQIEKPEFLMLFMSKVNYNSKPIQYL